MADVIWSDDADLVLKAPEVLDCFPAMAARLVEGTDGATGATGKTFTSAAVASTFITSGVEANMYLEITSGVYQGFYKVASLVAATLTLDRPIAASLTSLAFRVRSFSDWHSEAHAHYQDLIQKQESLWGDDWDDEDLHEASARDLRDLCVARVLATVFRAASTAPESIYQHKAKYWEGQESRLYAALGPLLLDDGADGEPESTTETHTGSIQAGIS
jgi:hypothetical protein